MLSAEKLPPDHFLAQLGIEFTFDGQGARGFFVARPHMYAPGTRTIRTAVLFAVQDALSGFMSGEPAGPTLSQRLLVLRPPPASGWVQLAVRPLRVGNRILVGEATFADDTGAPFARGLSTYMRLDRNGRSDYSSDIVMPESSFDEMLGLEFRDAYTVAFMPGPRHLNANSAGAIQGGVQALVAEVCAEHAFGDGRRMVAADLDVSFLTGLRAAPLIA